MKQILATSGNVEYRVQVSARPIKDQNSDSADKIQRHYNWLSDLARDTSCFTEEEVKEHERTLRDINRWGTPLDIEAWMEIMDLAYKVFDIKIAAGELNIAELESLVGSDAVVLAMLKNTIREMRVSKEEVIKFTKAMVLEMARVTDSFIATLTNDGMGIEVTA